MENLSKYKYCCYNKQYRNSDSASSVIKIIFNCSLSLLLSVRGATGPSDSNTTGNSCFHILR